MRPPAQHPPRARTRAAHVLVAVPLAALAAEHAWAQGVAPVRSARLTADNDLFALRGAGPPPDYDYTHGTRATLAWSGAPRWAGRLAGRSPACRPAAARGRGCLSTSADVAQQIYTPRRDAPEPIPGERPYGAWLFASGAAAAVTPGRVHTVAITLGTTGGPALGEPVQNGAHRLLGNAPQLGWPRQLATRLTAAARYEAVRWAERPLGGGTGAVRLRYGATVGTAVTGLTSGADLVVGRGGHLPWTAAEPEVERPTRGYVRVGYGQDLVLRNVFVQGWEPGAGASRRLWVPQGEAAVGYRWRRGAAEYRYVRRGREYRAQPAPHTFGSLAVTLHQF